jgi:hypothetical protein
VVQYNRSGTVIACLSLKQLTALQLIHDIAGERFRANPSKYYQRDIPELYY